MTTKYAFLDTNVFLHFVSVDQIDWRRQLDCDYVVLVVLPIVIRQLQGKKDSPGSRKLRDRAGSVLKKLESYSELALPIIIRDGAELRFHSGEPQIDFAAYKLSQALSDDWLIASILEFNADVQYGGAILITQDLPLKLKAKTHGIQSVRPSERYKLPEEEDSDRKRIRELEEQVLQLESISPQLKLAFKDGANLLRIDIFRYSEQQFPREMIDDKMAEIRCRYPKSDIIEEQRKNQLARTFQDRIEIQEFLNYNIRIEQFWADYEDFLEGCAQRLDWLQRLKKLELFLVNSGSCPATDIDITIHLTDCVELYKDGELPKLPVKPTPPIYPRSENEADLLSRWNLDSAFLKDISTALSLPMPKSFRTSFSNVSPVKISHTDSYELHVNVQGLKHHFKESICEFYIAYPSWDAVKSFEIDYLLIASNVPQKVAGTLNVKVEVEEANRAGN